MTCPLKYDFTSEPRIIWLWKKLSESSPASGDSTIQVRLHLRTNDHMIMKKARRDFTCLRWLNHSNTTSPQNQGPYDYEKTLRGVTCMRWLNHANTTSPQNQGTYNYEKTLRDVTCMRRRTNAHRRMNERMNRQTGGRKFFTTSTIQLPQILRLMRASVTKAPRGRLFEFTFGLF